MTFEEVLDRIGVDRAVTLHRFGGNAALLERFIRKFPSDPTYAALEKAAAQWDYPALEAAVHTLKGTSANLGFDALSARSAAFLEQLRAGVRGEEILTPFLEAVADEYRRVCEAVEALS